MPKRLSVVFALGLGVFALTACGSSTTSSDSANPSSGSSVIASDGSTPVPNGALLDAASKAAVDFGTYDYKTIQQSGWAFLNDLTPSYKNAYAGPAQQYIAQVVEGKSVSTASLMSSSLISQSDSKAVVVMTIATKLTGGSANPMNSVTKVQLTLLKQSDGAWLVDAAALAAQPQTQ